MKAKILLGLGLCLALGLKAQDKQSFDVNISQPSRFAVQVPDGNYRVTVTLGSRRYASATTILAENRRLMALDVKVPRRKQQQVTFIVNKRTPAYTLTDRKGTHQGRVSIKQREKTYKTWNDSLDLQFTGTRPAVSRITVEPAGDIPVVYLCGNSTVTDQPRDPYASWGQMVTCWFNDSVAICNTAESGLTARTFIGSHRLDQICSLLKKGDYVFCEFGHNDEKEHYAGDGAWYHFVYNLKIFVDRVREKGATIVFCTPTARRRFDESGRLLDTHGDFPKAMRAVAQREQVPLIELNGMSTAFFKALGPDDSRCALVHYPANTFAGQDKELADNTHFNPFGAYEISKMIVMGMKELQLPIVKYLRPSWRDFSPSAPDDWRSFPWIMESIDTTKPAGN